MRRDIIDRPIVYVARTIPSYRTAVLKGLNARFEDRLVACYGALPPTSALDDISGNLEGLLQTVRLNNHWLFDERAHFQNFLPALAAHGRPSAIIAEESPRSLSLPLLVGAARLIRAPIALWGHFSSNSRAFSEKNWADRYRIFLARRANACVCYTDGVADLLRPFVASDRLFVARNTLDTDLLFAEHTELERVGKNEVRKRIGLPADRPVISFIGRLIESKGTSLLVRVVERLQADSPTALVVIGDGPERRSMEEYVRQNNLKDVRFTGAINSLRESAPYLFASDVMLLPGYVGLAVNHAFALGVPIVTHASPGAMRYHSPEIEYVEPGKNGVIAKHADVEALARGVRRVLSEQEQFARRAREYARRHLRIDQMVDGLAECVRYMEAL